MPFKLMFETQMGANVEDSMTMYLRPETAQGIFANFRNVLDTTRVKIPFGIAQIGKSFRNEVTTKAFIFRTREFEQAELEFFCEPGTDEQWYEHWKEQRCNWYLNLGLKKENLRFRDHAKDELAHYAKACVDVEYRFPFGSGDWQELEGIANRTDYDLRQHQRGMRTLNRWFEKRQGPHEDQAGRRGRGLPVRPAVLLRRREEEALHPLRDRAQRRHGPQHAGVPGRCLRRGRGPRRDAQPAAVPPGPGPDQGRDLPAGQEGRHAGDRPQHLRRPEEAISTASTTRRAPSAAGIAARTRPAPPSASP